MNEEKEQADMNVLKRKGEDLEAPGKKVNEQYSIPEHAVLEHSTMGPSWLEILKSEFSKPYFRQLKSFLEKERAMKKTIFPLEEDIYSWSRYTPFDEVRVVIIGQDPYHNLKQAHGLCFSVQKGIHIPPSLVNIYREVSSDIEGFNVPNHGCLIGWAKQGVLLLNAVLTVEAHKANSHQGKGWEKLTDAVIAQIAKNKSNIVFMLWGNYAAKKADLAHVDTKKHLVLKSPHPSPLSARRGFFGCKHFSQANEYLVKNGQRKINWNELY